MKKLLGIVVLGLVWCNVGAAENLTEPFEKEDNVSLFGIVLGDNINNYEHENCIDPTFGDHISCFITPKIRNKSFQGYTVDILPISKKIIKIRAFTVYNLFSDREECLDNLIKVAEKIANSKKGVGLRIVKLKGSKDNYSGYYLKENIYTMNLVKEEKKEEKKLDKLLKIFTVCTDNNLSVSFLDTGQGFFLEEESKKLKEEKIDNTGL